MGKFTVKFAEKKEGYFNKKYYLFQLQEITFAIFKDN